MNAPSLATFATVQRQRADAVSDLARAVHAIDPVRATELEALAERTRHGQFRVVLIGCFSSGKSTLLNALLGQSVLPVKVNPCTAVVTEVQWAETPSVEVTWRNGEVEHLSPDAFHDRFQLQTDDPTDELDAMAQVKRAVVGWPLPLLANHVTLVDTPGLDDDPERTARTLEALPSADAVLMVLNATRFLTGLERRTLDAMRPMGLTTLFVPVAMTDLLAALTDDADAARASLEERAQAHLAPVLGEAWTDRVHWLDARSALAARRTDAPLPPAFSTFESQLESFLVHERGRARQQRLVDAVTSVSSQLDQRMTLERATRETSLQDLQARRSELGPQLARLDAIARRVERLASRFVGDQAEAIFDDLTAFLTETERALPDVVARIDVGDLAGLRLLVPSGRKAVEDRLRSGMQVWLDERMDAWRARCIPKLQTALEQLHDELATEGDAFDSLRADVLDAFTAGAVAIPSGADTDEPGTTERWFAVAVGAVLLSPGTVAAGWAQGYQGVLKGAAGRIGARLGVLAIGALLGPPGWAGLVVYLLADALIVLATGGSQLARTRERFASALQGKLVQRAVDEHDAITTPIRDALTPFRDALAVAARADADAVRTQLDDAIAAHATSQADAVERERAYAAVTEALEEATRVLSSEP